MTRPSTVPSTVSTALDMFSEWGVNFVTNVTTENNEIKMSFGWTGSAGKVTRHEFHSLRATRVKNSTSGHISLMTVALNFFKLHPMNRGFVATMFMAQVRSRTVEGQSTTTKRLKQEARISTQPDDAPGLCTNYGVAKSKGKYCGEKRKSAGLSL